MMKLSTTTKILLAALVAFPIGWGCIYLWTVPADGAISTLPFLLYSGAYVATSLGLLGYALHKLSETMLTDPVTNVYNKRYFFKALKVEFSKSQRFEQPLAIVTLSMVDVQKLAEDVGKTEAYIQSVFTGTIAEAIRETDIFSKIEANSYTLLLPNTDDDGAQVLSRRLKNLVTKEFSKLKKPAPEVSAFGVCSSRYAESETPIGMYDSSIKAHSQALSSERNRIISCSDCGTSCHIKESVPDHIQ